MKAMHDVAILVPSIDCNKGLQNIVNQLMLDEALEGVSIFVVIDGGVIEDEVMDYLLKKGVNVRVNPIRGGVASALNLGLDGLPCRFVRRMDADDEWINGSINTAVLKLLREYTLVFGYAINKRNGKYFKSAITDLPEGEISRLAFLPGNPITHPTVCFKSEVIEKLGGYSNSSAEDLELWMRILVRGYKIYNSDLPTVVYSRDQNLASRNLSNKDVLQEVQEKWLELVGEEFGLTVKFLDVAICRSINCEHMSTDIRFYKKDLSRVLKKLRSYPLESRLYMNIFLRSVITLIAHESKWKTVTFCFNESILRPTLIPNFVKFYLQDQMKLVKFKVAIKLD